MTNLLLCVDMDRTLIPNGVQAESPAAAEAFARLAAHDAVTLAYVTGRSLVLVEQAIAEFSLPSPEFVIADVGASLYQARQAGWQNSEAWASAMAAEWDSIEPGDIHHLLGVFHELVRQEEAKQQRYKLSYYLPHLSHPHSLLHEISARLLQGGIRANLVWSVDALAGRGLLDILPRNAGKLHAVRFLAKHLGMEQGSVVFAGDSGNDLEIFLSEVNSVLVANADDEVRAQIKDADPSHLYFAQGGLMGMNGNYRGGILEGVAHYCPQALAWCQAPQHVRGA